MSSLLRSRAARAIAAASLSLVPTVAASDRPSVAPSSDPSALLAAAASLPDFPPSAPAAPNEAPAPLAPQDAVHARAVLDRYYALSAEAARANDERKNAPANSSSSTTTTNSTAVAAPPQKKKHAPPRTPADRALVDEPAPPPDATLRVRHLIVGGGTAAWAALDALAAADPSAPPETLVVAAEPSRPYNRTPLSKEAWAVAPAAVPAMTVYDYKHIGAAPAATSTGPAPARILSGHSVVALDLDAKTARLSSGATVAFDNLLLATGGQPRPPRNVCPAFAADPTIAARVSSFRTLADYDALRERASRPGASVAIVGGGFLAAELAVSLSAVCSNVSLVCADAGVLFRVLPRYLCQFIAKKISDSGINVVTGAVVSDARVEQQTPKALADGAKGDDNEAVVLSLVGGPDGKNEVVAQSVVTAIGIEPVVNIAADAGLELDERNGGVRVNDFMMAEPNVFAAGDMASFHDRALGRRRIEHWDHAVVTGRIAGHNMAGKRERYGLQSMFWADLSNVDVDITAVGLVDSTLDTVAVWNTALPAEPATPAANELLTGVVYYVKNDEVVGVVLWNARKGVGALRRARALVDARTNIGNMPERVLGDLVNLDDGSFRMCVRTKGTPTF